jgi:hypothetical protein
MFKRLTLFGGAVAAAVIAFAAIAPASNVAAQDERDRDGTFLRGEGVLEARGDGLIAVKGRMDYKAHADRGVLLVKDIAGDAEIDVQGVGDCTGESRAATSR